MCQSRPALGGRPLRTLRVARRDRVRGSGRQRRVAYDAGLRSGVGATRRGHGVGALPLRALGLGGAMGLDVDRRRAMGLRAVPLRALGVRGRWMGLGAGPGGRSTGVRAGAGRVRGRTQLEPRHRSRPRRGLVPARAGGAVLPRLSREQHVHPQRERDQRQRHQHQRDERQRHEHQLPQSSRAGCRNGGVA